MTQPRSYSRLTDYDRAVRDRDVRDREDKESLLFVGLSKELTGFSEAELSATGMTKAYFDELGLVLGFPIRSAFLNKGMEPDAMLASESFGPLARNVIRMWYLGQWKKLPPEWEEAWKSEFKVEELQGFNEFGRNSDRVVSAEAYKQGLAWAAIGVNPPGAKQPGFGSWAERPPAGSSAESPK